MKRLIVPLLFFCCFVGLAYADDNDYRIINEDCYAALSPDILNTAYEMYKNEEFNGIYKLKAQGRLMLLKNGTKVRYLGKVSGYNVGRIRLRNETDPWFVFEDRLSPCNWYTDPGNPEFKPSPKIRDPNCMTILKDTYAGKDKETTKIVLSMIKKT